VFEGYQLYCSIKRSNGTPRAIELAVITTCGYSDSNRTSSGDHHSLRIQLPANTERPRVWRNDLIELCSAIELGAVVRVEQQRHDLFGRAWNRAGTTNENAPVGGSCARPSLDADFIRE